MSPHADATLYANAAEVDAQGRVANEGIWTSGDRGDSWTLLDRSTSENVVDIVAVSPLDSATLYGRARGGLRVSTDGGKTWVVRGQGLPAATPDQVRGNIYSIAANPRRRGMLWAIVADAIFKTEDEGQTWTAVLREFVNADGSRLEPRFLNVTAAANGTTVYAGSLNGAFSSVDGGATWRRGMARDTVYLVEADPSDSRLAYAKSYPSRLVKTTDGGATWAEVQISGVTRTPVESVAISVARPHRVYVATSVEPVPLVVRFTRSARDVLGLDMATYLRLARVDAAAIGPAGHVGIVTSEEPPRLTVLVPRR
jgi:photosystem II stability/assembly factor-like uncharacterized protein